MEQEKLKELEAYKNRLSVALRASNICIFEVDIQKQLYTYFENSETIFGKSGEEILAEVQPYSELPPEEYMRRVTDYFVHPDDAQTVANAFGYIYRGEPVSYEARMKAGNSAYKWCKIDVTPVIENGITAKMVGIIMNIARIKEKLMSLEMSVHKDSFTGLYSKKRFEELTTAVIREPAHGKCILMILDLDDFKSVNNQYGHMAGDEVLLSVSKHLQAVFSKKDLIARFGGDEFMALILDSDDVNIAKCRARELLLPSDNKFGVTKSIGIAVCSNGDKSYKELFNEADIALYQAKKIKNTFFIYGMDE